MGALDNGVLMEFHIQELGGELGNHWDFPDSEKGVAAVLFPFNR